MMHRLLILILCTVLLTACGKHITSVVGVTDNTVDEVLFTQGIEVYRENYCGLCHTLTIANTRGTFGPSHDDAVESAGRLLESGRYMGRQNLPSNTSKRASCIQHYSIHRALRRLTIICRRFLTCQQLMSKQWYICSFIRVYI